jgi:hypothetical protein
MGGKRLSKRTMSHAKLDMLIDYCLGDMERRDPRHGPAAWRYPGFGPAFHPHNSFAPQAHIEHAAEGGVFEAVTDLGDYFSTGAKATSNVIPQRQFGLVTAGEMRTVYSTSLPCSLGARPISVTVPLTT